jgi:hypothetical protein
VLVLPGTATHDQIARPSPMRGRRDQDGTGKDPGSVRACCRTHGGKEGSSNFSSSRGRGGWWETGLTKKRPGQGDWTGEYYGKRSNGLCRGHQIDSLFPLSLSLVFVQGDPYPEFCAQRTDRGVGFTLLWLIGYLVSFPWLPCVFSLFTLYLFLGYLVSFPWSELHVPTG